MDSLNINKGGEYVSKQLSDYPELNENKDSQAVVSAKESIQNLKINNTSADSGHGV
jgi:hypothetical protein